MLNLILVMVFCQRFSFFLLRAPIVPGFLPFSMRLISGSGDKILADCGRALLWSATRVLAVCIRVETFDFRGELLVRVCALVPISVH